MHPSVMRYLDPGFSQHLIDRQPEIDKTVRYFLRTKENTELDELASARHRTFVDGAMPVIKLWHLRDRAAEVYDRQGAAAQTAELEQTGSGLLSASLRQARGLASSWGGTLYW